jgi:hypothetical protein
MQQIADWLEKLGMSGYAQRFAESDVNTSVLRDLTDQDLKELGVSLGHRRKMLRAIAELAGAATTSPQPELTAPKPQDAAERRQVAVMFSNLVGSARFRPGWTLRICERSFWLIREVRRRNSAALRRVRREVHRRWGAGVLRYPQAHEHDAEPCASF